MYNTQTVMFACFFGFILGIVALSLWHHLVKRGKKERIPREAATVIYIDESLSESIKYEWRQDKRN